jgi:hypothetical protein
LADRKSLGSFSVAVMKYWKLDNYTEKRYISFILLEAESPRMSSPCVILW